MTIDPAQRHQIEQDAITAIHEAEHEAALSQALAATDENSTEAEFVAAFEANTTKDFHTGFDIRFFNYEACGDQVTHCPPAEADTMALYAIKPDGLSEWICDYTLDNRGAEQISARLHSLVIGALKALGLGAKIAGPKA